MTCFLTIGDIHFKLDNIQESIQFISEVETYILSNLNKIDFIVVLGDILHTHEKVHTQALNLALEFFKILLKYKKDKIYVLVGNHDMTTNTNFLNSSHWMNCLKEWGGIVVVDSIIDLKVKNDLILFCPYVPDGRFIEALTSYNKDGKDWKKSSLIFGHQLLNGVKMGMITATDVEEWNDNYPLVVSGHIHDKQWVKDNLYYTGSCRQISYGESTEKCLSNIIINEEGIEVEEIYLNLPSRRIIYITTDELDKIKNLKIKKNESIKLVITGDSEFFKEYKKTEKLKKELLDKGIDKVIFKRKESDMNESENLDNKNDFLELLDYMIKEENDTELYNLYKNLITNSV